MIYVRIAQLECAESAGKTHDSGYVQRQMLDSIGMRSIIPIQQLSLALQGAIIEQRTSSNDQDLQL